jgi:hypothetical protein
MTRPGERLRRIAALVVSQRCIERLIDPIVADMQTEYDQAWRAGRWWRASLVPIAGSTAQLAVGKICQMSSAAAHFERFGR